MYINIITNRKKLTWKKKIKRSNDSMEEKRRKVQNLKKKCVSCRQHGGTIFSSDEQYLKAKCAADKPCILNIEIKKGIYKYLPTEIEYHRKLLADLKKKIIRIKLDFLFCMFYVVGGIL